MKLTSSTEELLTIETSTLNTITSNYLGCTSRYAHNYTGIEKKKKKRAKKKLQKSFVVFKPANSEIKNRKSEKTKSHTKIKNIKMRKIKKKNQKKHIFAIFSQGGP